MSEKILLGRNATYDEPIFLSKHSWDCGWYWGFGYLGNKNCHFHFESYLKGDTYEIEKHLTKSNITQKEWWVIRDLFIQAYALKEAAAVYHHGGYQVTCKGVTDVLKDQAMVDKLNADLKVVLDVLWAYIVEAVKPKSMKEAA